MEHGMGGKVLAGGVLRDLMREVKRDDARPERQQHRAIAQHKEQEKRGERDGPPSVSILLRGEGEEEGGERAERGRGHHGHGEAAQQAAHAGEQAVVDAQLRAERQADGEDQRKRAAVDERSRVMPGKRAAHGHIAGAQQDQSQRAGAEDRAVRIGGDEVWRGQGQQPHRERGQGRGVAPDQSEHAGSSFRAGLRRATASSAGARANSGSA